LFFAFAAGPAAAGQTGIDGTGGGGLTSTSTTTTPTSTTTSSTTTTKSTSEKLPSSEAMHAFGSRMLTLGMRGTDVTLLQRDLTAVGFRAPATGRFNRLTLLRLKAFQRKYGLTVDGVAGPTTISTLKRLLSSKLHITESALVAREIAHGIAVTATSDNQPLPAGDSGLSGGVGLGTSTTGASDSTSTEEDATLVGGLVVPAAGTPAAIVKMLEAANRIAFDPYIYGGGHASFKAAGYDCSGSVSYVLHAGGLLASPLDSEQFLQYGLPGRGNWITIYTNGPTHAYMEIAGLWFDTAAQTALNGNDRWSLTRIGEPGYGKFIARHPAGW
jgi:peptidoglycan hydrolase-like protein with peptidoglycan-binding domain